MHHPKPGLIAHSGLIGLGEDITAECNEILTLIDANLGHANASLSTHMLDLHLAAARVALDSDDNTLSLANGTKSMDHLCALHIDAALMLITMGRPGGPEGSLEVVRNGLNVIRNLMRL